MALDFSGYREISAMRDWMQHQRAKQRDESFQELGQNLGTVGKAGAEAWKKFGGFGKLAKEWRDYKKSGINPETGKAWDPDKGEAPMSFKDWKKSDEGLSAKTKIKDDRALAKDKAFKERIAGKDWGVGAEKAFQESMMDENLPLNTAFTGTKPGAFKNWMKSEEGKKFKKQAKQDARVARRGERFVGRQSGKDWYDDARMTFDTQGGHFGDTSDAGFKRWMGTPAGEQAMEAAKSAVEADRRLPQEIAAARRYHNLRNKAIAGSQQWDEAQAEENKPQHDWSTTEGNIAAANLLGGGGMQLGTRVDMPSDPAPENMWDDYEAKGTVTLPPINYIDPPDPNLYGPPLPTPPGYDVLPTKPETPITEEWAVDEEYQAPYSEDKIRMMQDYDIDELNQMNTSPQRQGLLGRFFGGFKRGGYGG
tara:strand:+ start:865 stop:2127 length:1263 start_codon:yes stop_codon:yes gene_type:complete